MRFRLTVAAISLALTFCVPGQASFAIGANGKAPRVSMSGTATPPLGLQIFCLQHAKFCAGGPAKEVVLDTSTLRAMSAINRSVNASIRPQVRRTQVWELGARVGDCKDYAMNKRAQLLARGFPAGALRLAVGFTSRGEGHAVLVVRTNEGDLVLDNLSGEIKPFNRTGHQLTAISSPDLRKWQKI